MILRCTLDGIAHRAKWSPAAGALVVFDGDESFEMEALEARFYQVISATPDELRELERSRYRLLRRAADFEHCTE